MLDSQEFIDQIDSESILFAHKAEILLEKKMIEDALSLCEGGVKRFPFYEDGHFVLAQCYQASDRLDEAKNEYERVLFYSPGHIKALNSLAYIYYKKKLKSVANGLLLNASLYDPTNKKLLGFLKAENLYNILYKKTAENDKAGDQNIEFEDDKTETEITDQDWESVIDEVEEEYSNIELSDRDIKSPGDEDEKGIAEQDWEAAINEDDSFDEDEYELSESEEQEIESAIETTEAEMKEQNLKPVIDKEDSLEKDEYDTIESEDQEIEPGADEIEAGIAELDLEAIIEDDSSEGDQNDLFESDDQDIEFAIDDESDTGIAEQEWKAAINEDDSFEEGEFELSESEEDEIESIVDETEVEIAKQDEDIVTSEDKSFEKGRDILVESDDNELDTASAEAENDVESVVGENNSFEEDQPDLFESDYPEIESAIDEVGTEIGEQDMESAAVDEYIDDDQDDFDKPEPDQPGIESDTVIEEEEIKEVLQEEPGIEEIEELNDIEIKEDLSELPEIDSKKTQDAYEINNIVENIIETDSDESKANLDQYANVDDDFSTLMDGIFKDNIEEAEEDWQDLMDFEEDMKELEHEHQAEERPILDTAIIFLEKKKSDLNAKKNIESKDQKEGKKAKDTEETLQDIEAGSEKMQDKKVADFNTVESDVEGMETDLQKEPEREELSTLFSQEDIEGDNTKDELANVIEQIESTDGKGYIEDTYENQITESKEEEPKEDIEEQPFSEDDASDNISDIMTNPSLLTPTFGEILISQKKFEDARRVFEELAKQNPENKRYKKKIDFLDKIVSMNK